MIRGRVALVAALAAALACRPEEDAGPPAAAADDFAGRSRSRFDQEIAPPRAGDAAKAVEQLREARRQLSLGHPIEACDACELALVGDPANLDALLMLGTVELQMGPAYAPSKALLAFRTARIVDPAHLGARMGEVMARVALEDDARADELLEALVADDASGRLALSDDQRAVVRRSLATTALRAGRFEDALRQVDGALALRGNDAASVLLRAEVFERTQRLAEAEAEFARAIALQPDSGAAHFARARVLRRLGRAEDAERELRIHRALAPFEEDASKSFALDWPRRIELRRELIAAFPEFRRAHHLLARELHGGKQYAAERDELDRLLAEQPNDVEAWFLLARVHAKLGDREKARAAADRMLVLDPRRKAAHADLLQEIERGPDAGR